MVLQYLQFRILEFPLKTWENQEMFLPLPMFRCWEVHLGEKSKGPGRPRSNCSICFWMAASWMKNSRLSTTIKISCVTWNYSLALDGVVPYLCLPWNWRISIGWKIRKKFPATIFSPTTPTPNFWRSPFVSRRFLTSPATGTALCPARAVDVEARQWSIPGGKLCSSSLRPVNGLV